MKVKTILNYVCIFTTIVVQTPPSVCADDWFEDTKYFISETIAFDPTVINDFSEFKKYEKIYLEKLLSDDWWEANLSVIMVGFLKTPYAHYLFDKIKFDDRGIQTSVSFALCRLNQEYEKNYNILEKNGSRICKIEKANSFCNSDAIVLMSFLGDERFLEYAKSLKNRSDEAFQREIVVIAIERYLNIIRSNLNKRLE